MEAIVQYFGQIPSAHRAMILAGGIAFFWLLEYAVPLMQFNYNKIRHSLPNFFFTVTTIVVNFSLAFTIVLASDAAIKYGFGVLQWWAMPLWLAAIVGLLGLDFIGAYLVHFIQHKVKWMWRFHMVHHADTQVDTTTANRHHPGESVFRAVFTTLAVLIMGAPIWLVFLYQSLSVVLSQFNHANIKLPMWLDVAISYVIVSPNMHKVHHHYVRPETDTNYGNIFAIWDRLLGTYHFTPPYEIQYGLDVLQGVDDKAIGTQLQVPFRKDIRTDY
ncbi:MAG TPA: sterol desaturase [Chitinophagaceae bacterium]|nr:sterol desaturase [Chitinophagaceae bacterium]